jgi:outer membrane lipoprotein SlyB
MDTSFRAHTQSMNVTNMTGLINQDRNGSQKVPQDAFPPADLDLLQSNVREIEPERKTSMPVAVGSLVGTILPMIVMASREGLFKKAKGLKFPLKMTKKILTPFKINDKKIQNIAIGLKQVFAPFNVDYKNKKTGHLKIIALGGSAVLGGFLGGVINDKGKDTWEKVKEGNYQFITNIVMPVLLCIFFDEQVKKLGEKFPKMTWLTSKKLIHKIPISTLTNILGVIGGVTIGSFISNQLNKRIHKDEIPPRKIHAKDFLIQVDDMAAGFTATGALESIPVLRHVDKILPLVYFLSGMETGNEKGDEKGDPPSKAVT